MNPLKGIGLGNIFGNFLQEKEKNNWFIFIAFIFPIKMILKFSVNGLLTNSLKAPNNHNLWIKLGPVILLDNTYFNSLLSFSPKKKFLCWVCLFLIIVKI